MPRKRDENPQIKVSKGGLRFLLNSEVVRRLDEEFAVLKIDNDTGEISLSPLTLPMGCVDVVRVVVPSVKRQGMARLYTRWLKGRLLAGNTYQCRWNAGDKKLEIRGGNGTQANEGTVSGNE